MILVALAILVAFAAVAALGGAGLLGTGRPRLAAVPVVAAVGVVVVLVLAVAVLGGLRSGSHEEGGQVAETPATTVATVPVAPAPAPGPRRTLPAIPPGPDLRVVTVFAAGEGRLSPYPVVDALPPEGVVRVVASGFSEVEAGVVAQCVVVPGAEEACGRRSPVHFDGGGRADFQLLVSDTVDGGRCRVGRATCLLRLTGSESGRQATVQTVFVDRARRAAITLDPAVEDGRAYQVAVTVTGLDPGTEGVAVVCGPQEAYLARGCAAGGTTFVVGANGAGAATVAVGSPGVGADRVRCGPRRDCGVWVFVDDGYLVASAVPIRFPAGASASYDTGRLAAGLGIALALALAAVALVLTTDWTKPTEAAAPALEYADLQTAASLDDLFGTEAEIEERDPIPG
ncbi:MAG TPA: hypothetical protein VF244_05155 [Acidimicrobiales bacterium]